MPDDTLTHSLGTTGRPLLAGTRRRALTLASAGIAGLLGGCIVAPVGRPRHSGPPPGPSAGGYPQAPVDGPVVEVAPPPPQVEVIPVAPVAGWVWIGGHWAWHLGRHVWVGGRWVAPLQGHVWVGPRWVPAGPRAWRYHGGYWRRH